MASTTLRISITLSSKEPFSVAKPSRALTNYFIPRQHPPRSLGISFSNRRREKPTAPPVTSKKINKKKTIPKTVGENENADEDAFEALFLMLEEDLKNDELNGNDEISEEELAKLEQELAEALEDDELFGAFQSITNNEDDDDEDDDVDGDVDGSEVDGEYEEEEEEKEKPIKLKNWQMRRLAYALKTGRRKTSIKSLAAELCLDRAVVLKLLRDPPPNLVMLSAALPDKPAPTIVDPVDEVVETVVQVETETTDAPKTVGSKVKVPVHVMQSNWSARKRLKKVQVETLEQVYRRSKRPTNAMISSIVHVTNLPKKKVVKWFEDKREEEGVPEHRVPYQRSEPEPEPSVFT
ncbi:hypothetical protein ABFS83_05G143900 [Erythranthe nasuta]